MTNSMQHIKIQPSLIERIIAENKRVMAQITVMQENPTAYTGETFKHALCVMAWHCGEQQDLIETMRGHIKRVNHLIDQADDIYQTQAFTPNQAEKIAGERFDKPKENRNSNATVLFFYPQMDHKKIQK